MNERPILFSAPMARALLAGTKTQTRRIVKPQPPSGATSVIRPFADERRQWAADDPHDIEQGRLLLGEVSRCPYGQPGDRLRVKEAAWMWCERRPNGKTKTGRQKWLYVPMREAGIFYVANHPKKPAVGVVSPDTGNQWGWRLKIGRFLPSWASRITLEVTDVRVERAQDISESDAMAEGIVAVVDGYGLPDGSHFHAADPRISYWSLLDAINGPGFVESNPWVWAVSFKRITP